MLSYALSHNIFIEEIPKINENSEILEVCHGHGCDKLCIEPTHLSLQTKSINMYEDKIRDHMLPVGEHHYHSKLTKETVMQIRDTRQDGQLLERAQKFGVSISTINDIDHGRTWSHLLDINGQSIDTSIMRKKITERRKRNKSKIFTLDDWNEALQRLRDNSTDSVMIHPKVSTPCHLFNGAKNSGGYGVITFKGITYRTHILACEAKHATKRVDKNQIVRHLCDTPSCCNPEHLEYGTSQQNAIDAITNRQSLKLDIDKVKEIKQLLKTNMMTIKEIADIYHVTSRHISHIRNGQKWSHIEL